MIAPQPFFRPRGTPFSVLHRIRALRRLGHVVELVTYPFGTDPDLPGVPIHRAHRPAGVRDVPIGPSLAKLALDVPLAALALRLVRRRRFDLVHTHEEAAYIGAWIRQRYGIPHLYDVHSSLPQQLANFGRFDWRPVVRAFTWLERYTLRNADGAIAICQDLYDHVRATGFEGPLALIENTLDFDPPDDVEERGRALRARTAPGSGAVVCYTGTLEPYQGLDLLIAAAPAVLARAADTRFVLVGGDAEAIGKLRREAARAGVDGAFVFVPAVPPEHVRLYHAMADVLVTCRARGTNTPLKVYQYLRAGKPIVATGIRSHTQVLDDGCAELVEPTPEAVAAGLLRVLRDPVRARRLAERAGALAAERYGEAMYMSRLESLLAAMGIGTGATMPAVVALEPAGQGGRV